jgi:hypothetical protein
MKKTAKKTPKKKIALPKDDVVTVYIAGPMRGYDKYNFPAFDVAAAKLREKGFRVISPAEIDREDFENPEELPEHYLDRAFLNRTAVRDITALTECDAIYLLRGWEKSVGANAELAVARWMNLDVIYEEPPTETILAEATRITKGDRQRDYGHPIINHERIAALWNAYLSVRRNPAAPIDHRDAGFMMMLTKIARHANSPKRDNLVDIAGYARCLAQMEGYEE